MTKTKNNLNKISHKRVSRGPLFKLSTSDTSSITKYYTVIDLTDELNTKEYITEVTTVIDIIDLSK